MLNRILLSSLLSLLVCPLQLLAYEQAPLNLGYTSFMDGGPPAGPGIYYAQYLSHYRADSFKDSSGNDNGLPSPDLEVNVSLTQFIYMSPNKLTKKAHWGINTVIPIVGSDLDFSTAGAFPEANSTGLGDILVGPFLQWEPVMGAQGPKLLHRAEFQIILPTGKYDKDKEINPGSNFLTLSPYWAATYFFNPKLTSSLRLNYVWNAKNTKPNRGFGAASSTQAGQAFHLNYTLGYQFTAKLKAGLNAYYLKQINDTEVDGNKVSGRKERVLGLGPGLVYNLPKNRAIFFNSYFESQIINRTSGSRFVLRFTGKF